MIYSETDIDKILDRISCQYSIDTGYSKSVQFMISCLQTKEEHLSEGALEGFLVAQKYWLGKKAAANQLAEARTKCWIYLDKTRASTTVEGRDVLDNRIVLCTLYEQSPSSYVVELIDWFVEIFTMRFGESYCILGPRLEEFFPEIVSQ